MLGAPFHHPNPSRVTANGPGDCKHLTGLRLLYRGVIPLAEHESSSTKSTPQLQLQCPDSAEQHCKNPHNKGDELIHRQDTNTNVRKDYLSCKWKNHWWCTPGKDRTSSYEE